MILIDSEYMPEKSGSYLVKTISQITTPIGTIERVHFVQEEVLKQKDSKDNWKYSIDVHNQKPIEISLKPII